jgi:hypothetical protein
MYNEALEQFDISQSENPVALLIQRMKVNMHFFHF